MRADIARRCLLAFALLACGACVPGNTQKVPPVHGVLVCGAAPVADAAVTWTTENPSGDFVAGAVTDETGRFEIEAVKRWEWAFIVAPVHATARWRVEVSEKDGAARVLWRGQHYGLGPPNVPMPFVLECDLERREPCLLRDAPDDQRYLGSSGRLPIE